MPKFKNRVERSIKKVRPEAPRVDSTDLEVSVADTSADLEFFERLASCKPDDWQTGFKVYVYRVWPIIDRKDGQHFLAKVNEPFDPDYILRNWGSGKYHLKLNNQQGKTLATTTISCHNPDFPPRVDPAEVVVSDPRNDQYFKVWAKRQEAEPESIRITDSSAVGQAMQELGRIAREKPTVDKALADLYLETAKARDSLVEKIGSKQDSGVADHLLALEKFLNLVERLQSKERPTQTVNQFATVEAILSLVEKLRPTEQARNPVAQLKEMVDLVGSLKETFGTSESEGVTTNHEGTSAWERVAAMAFDSIKPAMPAIGNVIALKLAQTQTAPPKTSPTATGNQFSNINPSGVTPSTQPTPSQSAERPPAETGATGSTPIAADLMLHQLATLAIGALNLGMTGEQFAEQLSYRYGGAIYDQITAIPQEQLFSAIKVTPQVWQMLAPFESVLPDFIVEFYAWGGEEEPGEHPVNESAESKSLNPTE